MICCNVVRQLVYENLEELKTKTSSNNVEAVEYTAMILFLQMNFSLRIDLSMAPHRFLYIKLNTTTFDM